VRSTLEDKEGKGSPNEEGPKRHLATELTGEGAKLSRDKAGLEGVKKGQLGLPQRGGMRWESWRVKESVIVVGDIREG